MGEVRIPLEPDYYYHIYNHAVGKENLFIEDLNYQYFMAKVCKWILPVSCLLSYCLLPNHFHLLVRMRGDRALFDHFREKLLRKLSRSGALFDTDESTTFRSCMKHYGKWIYEQFDALAIEQYSHCFNGYVQGMNKTYARKGSLMKASFQRKKVDSEDYLRRVICYIHNNPVLHGFTESAECWRHSSYSQILSGSGVMVERNEVIELFDTLENLVYVHRSRIGDEIE